MRERASGAIARAAKEAQQNAILCARSHAQSRVQESVRAKCLEKRCKKVRVISIVQINAVAKAVQAGIWRSARPSRCLRAFLPRYSERAARRSESLREERGASDEMRRRRAAIARQ